MSASNFQSEPNRLAMRMPIEMIKRATEVLQIPSTQDNELSIGLYITNELKTHNIDFYIDDYGNIITSKGKPPFACFCAHMDTVHSYPHGFRVIFQHLKGRDYIYAKDRKGKPVGIGGDDKCGVFVCLELLKTKDDIMAVFFTQEESGGTGSRNIKLNVFKDCKFIGGIDRWNGNDFINKYSGETTTSKEFMKDIKPILSKYEVKPTSGLFTDALNLYSRYVNISCFNISCGYYLHHTDAEFVDLNELYMSYLMCSAIADLPKRYSHKRYNNTTTTYRGYGFGSVFKEERCIDCGIILRGWEYERCSDCWDKLINKNKKKGKDFKNLRQTYRDY